MIRQGIPHARGAGDEIAFGGDLRQEMGAGKHHRPPPCAFDANSSKCRITHSIVALHIIKV